MAEAAMFAPVRPPQIADPVDTYGKLLSIRRMQRQGEQQDQMFPEQLKSAQLQNQAHEQDIKDQQIWADSYRKAQGDIDKTMQFAAQGGASGKSIQAAQAHNATIMQHLATVEHTKLESDALKHDSALGQINAYRANKDDDWKAAHWQEWIQNQNKAGNFSNDETQRYLKQYPKYTDEVAEQISNNLTTGSQYSKKAADTARANNSQAQADYHNLQSAARTAPENPEAWTPWRKGLDAKTQAVVPEQFSADNLKRVRAMGMTPDQSAALPGRLAKSDQEQRMSNAAILGAQSDKDSYARAWYSMEPKQAQPFPHPDTFDPATTPGRVRQLGMTPTQQATAGKPLMARPGTQLLDPNDPTKIIHEVPKATDELGDELRQQRLEDARNRGFESIEKTKMATEDRLRKERAGEVKNLLAKNPFLSSEESIQAAAADPKSTLHDKAIKLLPSLEAINGKYAPRFQSTQDTYARSIRNRGGEADDYAVDPKTLEYRPVEKAASPPPAVTPSAAPKSSAKIFPRARLAGFAKSNQLTEAQAESRLKLGGWAVQ